MKYRICIIRDGGALELSPLSISPEAAAKRNPVEFMRFYEECRRVADKMKPKPEQKRLFEMTQ